MALWRVAVLYQDRVTFAVSAQVWSQEVVKAATKEDAVAACEQRHQSDPDSRRAIGFCVLGFSAE